MNTFFKNYLIEFVLIQITDAWQITSTWQLREGTEAGILLFIIIWALNVLLIVI